MLLWLSWKRCYTRAPIFTSMRPTISKFKEWRSGFKEKLLQAFSNKMRSLWKHAIVMEMVPMCATIESEEVNFKKSAWGYLFVAYKHVQFWFWCLWLNTLCLQSFVSIALTICVLYWYMWSQCIAWGYLLLLTVIYKYDQSLPVMDNKI